MSSKVAFAFRYSRCWFFKGASRPGRNLKGMITELFPWLRKTIHNIKSSQEHCRHVIVKVYNQDTLS